MIELKDSQIQDLRDLQNVCQTLHANLVFIGSIAYQAHFKDDHPPGPATELTAALDLDDLTEFSLRLKHLHWTHTPDLEYRWKTERGNTIDIIPAGRKWIEQQEIIWQHGTVLSLTGFEHVFAKAELIALRDRLTLKVAPPVVLTLLKIAAFLHDPAERQEDLVDLRKLLTLYRPPHRLVSGGGFGSTPSDSSMSNAFLLGNDLGGLCTPEEAWLVHKFLAWMRESGQNATLPFVMASPWVGERTEQEASLQITAFEKGFMTAT